MATFFASPSSISTAASTPQGFFSNCKSGVPLIGDEPHDIESMPFFELARLRMGFSRRTAFRMSMVAAIAFGIGIGMASGPAVTVVLATAPSRVQKAEATEVASVSIAVKAEPLNFENLPGFTKMQIDDRTVWFYEPPTINSKDRKAVIVLHGSEDSPEGIAEASNFHNIAARASPGFIVVYPEMRTPGGMSWGYDAPWEHAFFYNVVDTLVNRFAVARDEVFVTGHSAGGSMTLYLQNNLPELFKGAAAVEAGVGQLEKWHNSSYGRPTLVVWNHNDPVLAQYGGDRLFDETVATLRRHDDTKSWPSEILPLPAGYQGIVSAERKLWKSRKLQPQTHIISWSSDTPTHHWVNGKNLPGAPLDASILIWDFFQDVDKDD